MLFKKVIVTVNVVAKKVLIDTTVTARSFDNAIAARDPFPIPSYIIYGQSMYCFQNRFPNQLFNRALIEPITNVKSAPDCCEYICKAERILYCVFTARVHSCTGSD